MSEQFLQDLIDKGFKTWKEYSIDRSKILKIVPKSQAIAMVIGAFNYQVRNGGLEQWFYNRYWDSDFDLLYDSMKKAVGFDLGKESRTILAILERIKIAQEQHSMITKDGYVHVECSDCNGDGEYEETCPDCDGSGTTSPDDDFGDVCPTCDGDGVIIEFCSNCEGTGYYEVELPYFVNTTDYLIINNVDSNTEIFKLVTNDDVNELYYELDESAVFTMGKSLIEKLEAAETPDMKVANDFISELRSLRRFKPRCNLTGEDGNIFNLVAKASVALKRAQMETEARAMRSEVSHSSSYHDALAIISRYVDIY